MRFKLDENGHPVEIPTLGTARTVAIGATSAQSAALTADAVRLVSTVDCFIAIGSDPTAANTSHFFPAYSAEIIDAGAGNKIAAIQSASSGTLYISEVA